MAERTREINLQFEMKYSTELRPKEQGYGELAQVLRKPNSLASQRNCWDQYKRMSNVKLPEFLQTR